MNKIYLKPDEVTELILGLPKLREQHKHMSKLCDFKQMPSYSIKFKERAAIVNRLYNLVRRLK